MKNFQRLKTKTIALVLSFLIAFLAVPTILYQEILESVLASESTVASAGEAELENPYAHKEASFEITELREENVKHFRLEDGSFVAAQYGYPVHCLGENGWEDIDNRLLDLKNEYSNSSARIKFAKKITGNEKLFTINDGKTKITMSLVGAAKKTEGVVTSDHNTDSQESTKLGKMMNLENISSSIIYKDILEGVDLEYVVHSLTVKENIIVKEKNEDNLYSYTFEIDLNNLVAQMCEDGSVAITFNSGDTVYRIPAPIVIDGEGTLAPNDVAFYTLEEVKNGSYLLTVTVSSDWMNSEDRVYPVTVDPTIGTDYDYITDLYINSADMFENYESDPFLKVSSTCTTYIKINNTYLPKIPTSAYISSGVLNVYGQGDAYVGAYRVEDFWSSSLTYYDTIDDYIGCTFIPGVGRVSNTLLDYNNCSVNGYHSFDITEAVKRWFDGANHGVALKQIKADNAQTTTEFRSADSFQNEYLDAYRPQLIISYVDARGAEDYYSYTSQGLGTAGSGSVNLATGNLTLAVGTLSTTDSLMPMSVGLVYNSSIANKEYKYSSDIRTAYSSSMTPNGFKLNIQETVVKQSYFNTVGHQSYYYIFTDSDGTEHCFLPQTKPVGPDQVEVSNYVSVDDSGMRLILTDYDCDTDSEGNSNTETSGLEIVDVNGTVMRFATTTAPYGTSGAWYLTEMEDVNGNKVSFSFASDLRPTGVYLTPKGSEVSIKMLTIAYSNGKISMIRNDASNHAVIFKYSSTISSEILNYGSYYLRTVEYAYGTNDATAEDWSDYYTNGSSEKITVDSTATYLYYTSGRGYGCISSAIDNATGKKIRYNYDSAGRINEINEYGQGNVAGQTLLLYYGNGYSTLTTSGNDDDILTNEDNIVTCYIFDNLARCISSYSTDWNGTKLYGAVSGKYEDAEVVKNNIKESTTHGGSYTSYLLNGSFEIGDMSYWSKSSGVSRSYNHKEGVSTGEFCAVITPESYVGSYLYQTLFLPAGEYTFSLMYEPWTYDRVGLYLQVLSLDATPVMYANERIGASEVPLKEMVTESVSFTVPNVTDGGNNVMVRVLATKNVDSADSSIYIDDLALTSGTGVSRYEFVSMGDFNSHHLPDSGISALDPTDFWTGDYTLLTPTNGDNCVMLSSDGVTDSATVKQTVYELDPFFSGLGPNEHPNNYLKLAVSGFGYASNVVQKAGEAFFGLRVKVYYMQNLNEDDIAVSYEIPFQKICNCWQFVNQTIDCELETTDTFSGATITKIELICEFSGQAAGACAFFDNLSVRRVSKDDEVKNTYDQAGNVIAAKNHATTIYYDYDRYNNKIREGDDYGNLIEYEYDMYGKRLERMVEYSFTWRCFGYTTVDGEQVETEFPTTSTAFNNDSYYYEKFGSDNTVIMIKTPKAYTEYTYNDYGLCTSTVTYVAEEGQVFELDRRDDARHLESVLSGETQLTEDKTYNSTLRERYDITAKASVQSITTSSVYETTAGSGIFGALIEETTSDGESYEYFYNDKTGYLLASMNKDSGRGICYTYDPVGKLTGALPASYSGESYVGTNNAERVSYTYGSNGYLELISTESTTYDFSYDCFGNSTDISVGERTLVAHEYNQKNGKLKKLVYSNGYTEDYVYDEVDNLTEIWYTVNGVRTKAVEYVYTNDGQLHSVSDLINRTVTVYKYDLAGRISGLGEYRTDDYNYDIITEIVYDGSGRVSNNNLALTYTVLNNPYSLFLDYTYTYRDDGTIAGADVDGLTTERIGYGYDELKRLKSVTYNSGNFRNTVSYTYSAGTTSKIEKYTSTIGTGDSATINETAIEYNDDGYITKLIPASGRATEYFYDDLGQLIRENCGSMNKTYVYTYDNAGNITSKKVYAYTTGTLGTPTETKTYGYTDSDWGDLLTSYGGVNITYDAIGNPLSYYNGSQYSFTWEGRRLKTATKGDQNFTFTYNSDGIRTSKVVDGVEHVYVLDGTQIVAEMWDDKTLVFIYDATGSPVGLEYMDADISTSEWHSFRFEKNIFGDVVAIYNSSGQKVISYIYDAWGNLTQTTHVQGTVAHYNPFRYRGYYYDTETGFYITATRYYNPETGRFINADGYVTTGQGILGNNMFAYCGNNPVNRVDPMGQFWNELWDAFTQAIQQASGYFAFAAGVSQADTLALGPADVASGILLLGGVLVCAGIATYTAITAPAPSISIPKVEGKDEVLPAPPPSNGTTYYHVTTQENATAIMVTGIMIGSKWEGGFVYAWKTNPSKYAIENSGAHMGVTISFKTNALFVMDTGITNPKVQMYGPVVSTIPGPIVVWDVQIVR